MAAVELGLQLDHAFLHPQPCQELMARTCRDMLDLMDPILLKDPQASICKDPDLVAHMVPMAPTHRDRMDLKFLTPRAHMDLRCRDLTCRDLI